MSTYAEFLERKSQLLGSFGFEPEFVPDWLFDFQQELVRWACRQGRAAIFADCGMGKTPMQLVWAENVRRHTKKPVLILTPLAVGPQTVGEGSKFGIPCVRSRDGAIGPGIVITNYEKLHLFHSQDFSGVVCDESSILKSFRGTTQKAVTEFMRRVPYRLLCTATAAPNDYVELGTSAEALGVMGMVDMLSRFFKQDEKTSFHARQRQNRIREARAQGKHSDDTGHVVAGTGAGWRLKGHAELPFWKWVASWARACRKPSDLGFEDEEFMLPELIERSHVIIPERPRDGMLFTVPAIGLNEEREERRRTLHQRCRFVADLVKHDDPAVVWCHLNDEGDLLSRLIPDARQVKGADSDDEKEESYRRFAAGEVRVLVIKPKIGAWGLNWQHCHHVVTFASHSYEQFYQSVRRCWRYGQTQPVTVDIIATEGEQHVRDNMIRKAQQADRMFAHLVTHMHDSQVITRAPRATTTAEVPAWL